MDNFEHEKRENKYEPAGILPLPLTSIEKFHFFDGDELYPNLIFGRLLFEESIDEDVALRAWKIVTCRQPLIHAGIKRLHGQLHWAKPSPFEPAISANETFQFQRLDSAPAPWSLPRRMEPNENPGPLLLIRVWIESRDQPSGLTSQKCERAEVWFWAHHTLCDGAAAVVFINDWLQIYRNLISKADTLHRVSRIDSSLILRRNDLGIFSWDFLKHLPQQIVGLYGAAKFIFRKTATYERSSSTENIRNKTIPAVVSERLPEDLVQRLNSEADELNVSLNSILISDLFRTLHKWRIKQGYPKREWLRIILPMNIREFKHRELPVANRTSIVQIDRRDFESTSRVDLIRSINHEVKIIRRWYLDRMFLIFVRVMSLFEFNLRKAAQNGKSRGIAVFTNLGRPIRKVPDFATAGTTESLSKLREFDFVGPVRQGTPFNFAVGKFRRGMRITLHFDSTIFSANDADELLHVYCQELGSVVHRTSGENGAGGGFVNQN